MLFFTLTLQKRSVTYCKKQQGNPLATLDCNCDASFYSAETILPLLKIDLGHMDYVMVLFATISIPKNNLTVYLYVNYGDLDRSFVELLPRLLANPTCMAELWILLFNVMHVASMIY